MKVKTTRKAIVDSTPKNDLVSVGYCDLQMLLSNHSPIAYTCGIYGWNFDAYEVYGKTICTGYRGMPGRTPNNYRKYENEAKKIREDYSANYEERQEKIEKLLEEFCKQA